MLQTTHTYPNTETTSGRLDFYRVDPETLAQALSDLNVVVDAHSALMRQDSHIADALLRYENQLIDAQGGDASALKKATAPEEFDKLIALAENKSHPAYAQLQKEYFDFRVDLLQFKHKYLSATRAD